jgi:protein-disulfide isomerase
MRTRIPIGVALIVLSISGYGKASAEDVSAPPGVDLSKLDEGEKKIFFRVGGKVGSACGKAHSLLQSVKSDPSCRRSLLALRQAAKLSHEGYLESEITEALEKRYLSHPSQIDVSDAPLRGDPKAPVTIIEFADFECPHCRHLQPVLERLLDDFKGQVKVYFKHFPLRSHSNAESAALAAVAAQRQGKFWAVTAKLWQNQEALSDPDLEKYAKQAGLDVKKWRGDLVSAEVKERLAKDRAEGDKLNISGTPAVYVNGREVGGAKDYEALKAWVQDELEALR